MTSHAWRNAQLPIRKRGLGLTPAIPLADVAYVSSITSCVPLIQGLLGGLEFSVSDIKRSIDQPLYYNAL